MQADKYREPDGFNLGFYQHFWNTCGPKIFNADFYWLELLNIMLRIVDEESLCIRCWLS